MAALGVQFYHTIITTKVLTCLPPSYPCPWLREPRIFLLVVADCFQAVSWGPGDTAKEILPVRWCGYTVLCTARDQQLPTPLLLLRWCVVQGRELGYLPSSVPLALATEFKGLLSLLIFYACWCTIHEWEHQVVVIFPQTYFTYHDTL